MTRASTRLGAAVVLGAATLLAAAGSGAAVERLATMLGCAPTFAGHPSDFRQASCTVGGANMVLLDFRTSGAQRAWLDEAVAYDGPYLSGDRWVLTGRFRDYLVRLRERLGGAIEEDLEMQG